MAEAHAKAQRGKERQEEIARKDTRVAKLDKFYSLAHFVSKRKHFFFAPLPLSAFA
jgi:hypothetical protein